MSRSRRSTPGTISNRFINTVCTRLKENKRVRRTLPVWGRLHIDRQLPFLSVYRRPTGYEDIGTRRLVLGEAAYLTAVGDRSLRPGLLTLVQKVVKTLSPEFGAFLLLEIWAAPPNPSLDQTKSLASKPAFRILASKTSAPANTIDTLEHALKQIRIFKQLAQVEVVYGRKRSPVGLPLLISPAIAKDLDCFIIGLEVQPIYRHAETGELFPLQLRALHRGLARALKQAFFEFTRTQTTHRPHNYQVLGRQSVVKAVWEMDRQLANISGAFDFLLQVTPINSGPAWARFKQARFQRTPVFHYRPVSVDPALLKRKLYAIPLEGIEDPTLAHLFQEKRQDLDRQLSMLLDRDTPQFLYGSMQIYGRVDDTLLELAYSLLSTISPRSRESARGGYLNASEFAERAEAEFAYYRQAYPDMSAAVQIRSDVTGLMVSRGNLLISRRTRVPVSRVEALLQHEVGTHIVTYFNGRAQPFRQLYTGLAGYEELQEGLAVLSEYLVGGLSRPRLRLLAGRVVAVRRLTEGASFIDTFHELNHTYGFAQRTAYTITMRIYRGGGLTKDAVYLKGLAHLLAYLKKGGAIEPLFIGKIMTDHVPLIRELQWRQVLQPVPLWPRYMANSQTAKKLTRLRNGLSVLDLIERKNK
jgi:uncharacterized protein (TIGR02421 family)